MPRLRLRIEEGGGYDLAVRCVLYTVTDVGDAELYVLCSMITWDKLKLNVMITSWGKKRCNSYIAD